MGQVNVKVVARVSSLSALSFLGASIPLPSPVGSVALDSAPGYFAALAYGPMDGSLVCAIGHILSSMRAGYPLGLMHVPVTLLMASVGMITAVVSKRVGVVLGLIVGVSVNVMGALIVVPIFGWGILIVLVPWLAFASAVNASMAGFIFKAVERFGVV